jgi:hypothetical protein
MRVQHQLIPLADRGSWEAALDTVRHSFFHTWAYNGAIAATTRLPASLYVCEWAGGRVVCPLLERPFDGHTDVATPPGFPGPVATAPFPTFSRELKRFARTQGWVSGYIGLDPTLTDPALASDEDAVHHNDVYVLDLSHGEAGVAARLSRNRRRQLRYHDEHRLVFERERVAEFLVERVGPFYEERGASRESRLNEESIRLLCSADAVRLVGVEVDGRVQAAAAFASTAWLADAVAGAGTPTGRALSFHLVWDAVRHYTAAGIPRLNLGGGVRRGDSVAEFKRRFGADVVPLRALRQVYNPDAYRDLCERAGRDPSDRSGYFPAYRRPAPVTSAVSV